MCFAAAELIKLSKGKTCIFITLGTHCKRDQYFIDMHERIMVAKMLNLELLYRLDNRWCQKYYLIGKSCKMLQRIQKHS